MVGQEPGAAPAGLRERVLVKAIELTCTQGWAWVTMDRVAKATGISRRTVYNEVGGRQTLAEAMVMHELDRFLGVVELGFDQHPEDLLAAMRAAVGGVLELAQHHLLLRAVVVAADSGGAPELLPFLTVRAGELLDAARATVLKRFSAYSTNLTAAQAEASIDVIIRVVVSHLLRPGAAPAEVAEQLTWVAARVLSSDDATARTWSPGGATALST